MASRKPFVSCRLARGYFVRSLTRDPVLSEAFLPDGQWYTSIDLVKNTKPICRKSDRALLSNMTKFSR